MHFNPRATRGATVMLATQLGGYAISIHAPHGVRPHRSTNARYNVPPFQSTHDTGRDVIRRFRLYNRFWISIHAPHRARPSLLSSLLSHCSFQSTRHTGCDAAIAKHLYQQEHFNPRTTRGATVYNIDISGSIIDFNPRATRGATYERGKMQIMEYISIHAPHGARPLITLYCNNTTMYFNPRATRGATRDSRIG